jgi:hypothetical protein
MINNSGPGIQKAAGIITAVGVILSVVMGIAVIAVAEYMWILFLGIFIMPVGMFGAWFTGKCIKGFGEIVDNVYHLRFPQENGELSSQNVGEIASVKSGFCGACGAELVPGCKFCDNCGAVTGQ